MSSTNFNQVVPGSERCVNGHRAVIDKGIPIPKERPAALKYPFDKMRVGDSFSVPALDRNLVSSAAYHYGRRHGMSFTVRTSSKEQRVWRIK